MKMGFINRAMAPPITSGPTAPTIENVAFCRSPGGTGTDRRTGSRRGAIRGGRLNTRAPLLSASTMAGRPDATEKVSCEFPTSTVTPGATRVGTVTRAPATNVPLLDARSSMVVPSSRTWRHACCRDTSSSDGSARSVARDRPMT